MMQGKLQAKIAERIVNTPDVVTLSFTVGGQPLKHTAGQYITVYFDDTAIKQGKAYSLSSSPTDQCSSITVKKIGLFSGKLHDLKVGDSFTISQPYGFFHAQAGRPMVALAAGVGLSPIWSIIRYEAQRDETHSPIKLLYTNKTDDDIIFKEAIDQLTNQDNKVKSQYFVTRQPNSVHLKRRIEVQRDVLDLGVDSGFYICGPQGFVRSMWQQLIAAGVNEDLISTETFFETV